MNNIGINYISKIVSPKFNREVLASITPEIVNGEEIQFRHYWFVELTHLSLQKLIIGVIEVDKWKKGIIILLNPQNEEILELHPIELDKTTDEFSFYLENICLFPVATKKHIPHDRILDCHIFWGSLAMTGNLNIKPFVRDNVQVSILWKHIYSTIDHMSRSYHNDILYQCLNEYRE